MSSSVCYCTTCIPPFEGQLPFAQDPDCLHNTVIIDLNANYALPIRKARKIEDKHEEIEPTVNDLMFELSELFEREERRKKKLQARKLQMQQVNEQLEKERKRFQLMQEIVTNKNNQLEDLQDKNQQLEEYLAKADALLNLVKEFY
jgi:chromosome segregation ATPase